MTVSQNVASASHPTYGLGLLPRCVPVVEDESAVIDADDAVSVAVWCNEAILGLVLQRVARKVFPRATVDERELVGDPAGFAGCAEVVSEVGDCVAGWAEVAEVVGGAEQEEAFVVVEVDRLMSACGEAGCEFACVADARGSMADDGEFFGERVDVGAAEFECSSGGAHGRAVGIRGHSASLDHRVCRGWPGA